MCRLPREQRSPRYRLEAHYYSRGPMGYGMGKLQIIDHDGTILREATAEQASWRDPADTSPNRRNPKQIEGYRAADALITLKKRGGQITQLHMRAANRLRSSHELGELGVRPGYERPEVGSAHFGPTDGPNVMRLDALQSYREAKAAVKPTRKPTPRPK